MSGFRIDIDPGIEELIELFLCLFAGGFSRATAASAASTGLFGVLLRLILAVSLGQALFGVPKV